jgi:taurine--2-oxoglutarate transaminase
VKKSATVSKLAELDKEHNFYSWSVQSTLAPMMVSRASGMHVYDMEDNEYLD